MPLSFTELRQYDSSHTNLETCLNTDSPIFKHIQSYKTDTLLLPILSLICLSLHMGCLTSGL